MTKTTTVRHVLRVLIAAAMFISSLLVLPIGGSVASAEGCPDVEVVFARGTAEPPGIGWTGQQFVDALRWRVGPRPLDVYAVNFTAQPEFATTVGGVVDAGNRIRDITVRCPDTQMVLGGFSRGAALVGYVTAPVAPAGYEGIIEPLPPEAAGHVVAVVQLGKPSAAFLGSIGAPPLVTNADYAARTIDLCAPGDPICSSGDDGAAHTAYVANGMTQQAADFAADRIGSPEAPPDQPL